MKQLVSVVVLAAALLTAACGGDSKLPVASGKATIRAINAIQTSPNIGFRIEERTIEEIPYQQSSGLHQYDDLDYTFNFDVFYAGDDASTRIASQNIDFVVGQEYTLLLTGTVASPVLTLWENPRREFDTGGTVFQLRFTHTSEIYELNNLDFYFAADGVVPAAGEEVASVAFGDASAPLDFEAGDYVLTITSGGDPGDILYTSDVLTYTESSDLFISTFDSTPNRNSLMSVYLLGNSSGGVELADASTPTTVEFLHAALDLGDVNIYDDELLTSQVLADHMYTDLSPEILITPELKAFRYESTLAPGTEVLAGELPAVAGRRYRFMAIDLNDTLQTAAILPDRRPYETSARILLGQSSSNIGYMEIYFVNSGDPIDDSAALKRQLSSFVPTTIAGVPAGDYDIYVTDLDAENILDGPIPVSVVLGDVLDIMIFDVPTDPALLDLQILPSL